MNIPNDLCPTRGHETGMFRSGFCGELIETFDIDDAPARRTGAAGTGEGHRFKKLSARLILQASQRCFFSLTYCII